MKANKAFIYPLVVLSIVGFLVFSIFFMVGKMGERMNPPQAKVELEGGISSLVVWKSEGSWKASQNETFSIFEAKVERPESGKSMEAVLGSVPHAFLFLLVKEDVGKETVLELLEVLSKFKVNRVYVASPFDNTLVNLKRAEPRFWYAPSPKTWIKWSLFTAYYLETFYDPKADFLFVDEGVEKILSPRLEAEIKRRNMVIIP